MDPIILILSPLLGFIGGFLAARQPWKKKKPKPRIVRPDLPKAAPEYLEPKRTRIKQDLDAQTLEKELKRLQKHEQGPI